MKTIWWNHDISIFRCRPLCNQLSNIPTERLDTLWRTQNTVKQVLPSEAFVKFTRAVFSCSFKKATITFFYGFKEIPESWVRKVCQRFEHLCTRCPREGARVLVSKEGCGIIAEAATVIVGLWEVLDVKHWFEEEKILGLNKYTLVLNKSNKPRF